MGDTARETFPAPAPNLVQSTGGIEVAPVRVDKIKPADRCGQGRFALDRYDHVRFDPLDSTVSQLSMRKQSFEKVSRGPSARQGDQETIELDAGSGGLPSTAREMSSPRPEPESGRKRKRDVKKLMHAPVEAPEVHLSSIKSDTPLPDPKEIDAMLVSLRNDGIGGFQGFFSKHWASMPRMRDSQRRPILVALVQASAAARNAPTPNAPTALAAASAGTKRYALDFLLAAVPDVGRGRAAPACPLGQAIDILLQAGNAADHLRARCLWDCNALIHSASLGDHALVQRLLAVSPRLSVEQVSLHAPHGHALVVAALAGHVATVAALLRNPALAQIQIACHAKGGNVLMRLLREKLERAAQIMIEAALAVPPHNQGALIFTLARQNHDCRLRPIDLARAQGLDRIVDLLAPWSPPLRL